MILQPGQGPILRSNEPNASTFIGGGKEGISLAARLIRNAFRNIVAYWYLIL